SVTLPASPTARSLHDALPTCAARARRAGEPDRALHGRDVAADDHLAGRVVIRRHAFLALHGRVPADALDLLIPEPENGCHRPRPRLAAAVHELAAPAHRLHRGCEVEAARGHVSAEFAERVPRREADIPERFRDQAVHGDRVHENRGLRIVRRGQLLLGTLPRDAREVDAERVLRLAPQIARSGVALRDVAAHADELGALARKQERYQRRTAEPQVNPAPNATRRTLSPGFRRPCSCASSSAIGTVAELMLP